MAVLKTLPSNSAFTTKLNTLIAEMQDIVNFINTPLTTAQEFLKSVLQAIAKLLNFTVTQPF